MKAKDYIFTALKDKFKDSGITKMIFSFIIKDESYNVMFKNSKAESMKLDLEIDRKNLTLIKAIFVTKIKRKYEKDNKGDKLKAIIVQINFETESFEIFTENEKGIVYKFEY